MRNQVRIAVKNPMIYSGEELVVYVEAPSAPRTAASLSLAYKAKVVIEIACRVFQEYEGGDLVTDRAWEQFYLPPDNDSAREDFASVCLLAVNKCRKESFPSTSLTAYVPS